MKDVGKLKAKITDNELTAKREKGNGFMLHMHEAEKLNVNTRRQLWQIVCCIISYIGNIKNEGQFGERK